jgi:hypothetical protein
MANGPGQNITALASEAVRDTTELARKELALFKTELSEGLRHLAVGADMMVGAAVFAIAALFLLTEALVEWLATVVNSEALAALIVGGVLALITLGLALYGRSAFASFSLTPQRTIRTLNDDVEVLSKRLAK